MVASLAKAEVFKIAVGIKNLSREATGADAVAT